MDADTQAPAVVLLSDFPSSAGTDGTDGTGAGGPRFLFPDDMQECFKSSEGGDPSASRLAGMIRKGHRPAAGASTGTGGAGAADTRQLERSIRHLLQNGRVDVAACLCGADSNLQLLLLDQLLSSRQFDVASSVLQAFLGTFHRASFLANAARTALPPSDLTDLLAVSSWGRGRPVPVAAMTAGSDTLPKVFNTEPVHLETSVHDATTIDPDFKLGGRLSISDIAAMAAASPLQPSSSATSLYSTISLSWSTPLHFVVFPFAQELASNCFHRAPARCEPSCVSGCIDIYDTAFPPAKSTYRIFEPHSFEGYSLPLLVLGCPSHTSNLGQPNVSMVISTPVLLVDTVAALDLMRETWTAELEACRLSRSRALDRLYFAGVDVEWRPDGTSALGSPGAHHWPASIIQVATPHSVFIVDLLALHQEADRHGQMDGSGPVAAALDCAIGDLLRHEDVIKVGYGLNADLRKLCSSYPYWLRTFARAAPSVELPAAIVSVAEFFRPSLSRRGETAANSRSEPPVWLWEAESLISSSKHSLSSLVSCVLGLPLCKSQQTSDWQQRPLSAAQVQYAALDAAVLVAVMNTMLLATFDAPIIAGALGDIAAEVAIEVLRSACTDVHQGVPTSTLLVLGEVDASYQCTLVMPSAVSKFAVDCTSLSTYESDAIVAADPLLSPVHVRSYLSAHGCDPSAMMMPVPASATASAGAVALKVTPARVVKTLSLIAAGVPIVALVRGDNRLDLRKLAAASDCSRGSLHMATASECAEIFGYTPGSFPPFAHRARFRTFIDDKIHDSGGKDSNFPSLFVGGGSADCMIQIDWEQLRRLTDGVVKDITIECSAPSMSSAGDNELCSGGSSQSRSSVRTIGVSDLASPQAASSSLLPRPPSLCADSRVPKPRFVLDSMLGRLTRWLRVIGVDAESTASSNAAAYQRSYSSSVRSSAVSEVDNDSDADDGSGSRQPRRVAGTRLVGESALVQWVNDTGSILVTRDRKIMQRRDCCAVFWMPANDTPSQFEILTAHFGITVCREDLMSRCAKCNGKGYDHCTAAQVREMTKFKLPEKVLNAVTDFWRCRRCGKLYWEGVKFADTRNTFLSLFPAEA